MHKVGYPISVGTHLRFGKKIPAQEPSVYLFIGRGRRLCLTGEFRAVISEDLPSHVLAVVIDVNPLQCRQHLRFTHRHVIYQGRTVRPFDF